MTLIYMCVCVCESKYGSEFDSMKKREKNRLIQNR